MDPDTQRTLLNIALTVATAILLYLVKRWFPNLDISSESNKRPSTGKIDPVQVQTEPADSSSTTTSTKISEYHQDLEELNLKDRKLRLLLTEIAVQQIDELSNHLQETRELANKAVQDLEKARASIQHHRKRTKMLLKLAKLYQRTCKEYKQLLERVLPEENDNDD